MTISTIVDTNILIDLVDKKSSDAWSMTAFLRVAAEGPVIVNAIIWAELAAPFPNEKHMQEVYRPLGLRREELPFSAAFAAGKAHWHYRRRGGHRERPLPDFLIGAHALIGGHRVLTRDPSRYRTYFPDLDIIAPDVHP